MTYKTLLLHVDDSLACAKRTQVAVDLVQTFDAHLMGLYGVPPFPIPAHMRAELGEAYETWCKRLLKDARERAQAAFENWISHAGIAAEWRCAERDVLEAFQIEAPYADLIIVGQTDPDPESPSVVRDFPELICLSSGRPVLIIPYAGAFARIGKHVLIAWNGSREAARAVSDALPFLKRASQITVLAVNAEQDDSGHRDDPGANLVNYLARHGVKAEATQSYSDEVDAGNLLLSRAADLSADLLVMGAYGHSRVREMVLGGVTRTLLRDMTLPVLMSH
ncbi:MAG TPA: universal stress protein [Burkholderiales bacterium]|nr:universal stress protein [Burkholderiales bacterium]